MAGYQAPYRMAILGLPPFLQFVGQMRVKQLVFNRLCGRLGDWIGRAGIVRVGQYLCRSGRLDAPDGIANNGEALAQRALASQVSGLTTVVDCGANSGQWSAALLSEFRRQTVGVPLRLYCFEPSHHTFQQLTGNLKPHAGNGVSIHAVRQVLSKSIGTATLYVVHEMAGTNSLTYGGTEHRTTEVVEVTTLTSFARRHNIDRIDLLKIDAKGHDYDVLVGARDLIERGAIEVIQFEYNQRWIYGGRFLRDVFQLLADTDYAIGKVTPRGIQWQEEYDWRLESFVQGNWLACVPRLVSTFGDAPRWLRSGRR